MPDSRHFPSVHFPFCHNMMIIQGSQTIGFLENCHFQPYFTFIQTGSGLFNMLGSCTDSPHFDVQSILSLTNPLRGQLVKCFTTL